MTKAKPSNHTHRSSGQIDFSTVIASSVHDMKSSLGMLLHSLDGLRQEHQGTLTKSVHFNTLQYEAERLHSDLIQLLGLYRIGEQSLSAHVEEHFVPDFLSQQLSRHQPLLEGHNVGYSIEADDINGFFDDDLLTGVLNNTINNAIRYTKSRIRLTATEREGYLVIGLEDDGDGYPERMQKSGAAPRKPLDFNTGNTSLGLFFASAVATLHQDADRHGFIKLHNGGSLGGGVFEIWLP
jgi:K+-sensing histidine kinase KdpD